MERAAFTKEELAAYNQRRINLLASKSDLEEERIKGKAEGEKQKAIDIAKEMLADGMPIDKIAKFTGLSTDEIKALQ